MEVSGEQADEFKKTVINQYLICEVNSPFLLSSKSEKVNHLISILILQKTGHIDFLDEMISIQMKK